MKIINYVLGFIVVVMILSVVIMPYYLVIWYIDSSKEITEISKTAIPWLIALLIVSIFNIEIKNIFTSLSEILKKPIEAGIGTSTFKLNQGTGAILTGGGDIEEYKKMINEIQSQKQNTEKFAIDYYVRYIYSTIYRSQIEYLQNLKNSKDPTMKDLALLYYNQALQRNPKMYEYMFEDYFNYLLSNMLITKDSNNKVIISALGLIFLAELEKNKIPLEKFNS